MDSYLVEVVSENLGSALAADASTAATSIVVDWSPEYSEDGCTILLNGQTIDVDTAVYADDNESVTLTFDAGESLNGPAVISDFVQLVNPNGTIAQTYTALVNLQGSDRPVEATIPLGLMDQFSPDDAQEGAIVNVEDDGAGGYTVTDRPTDVPSDPTATAPPTDTFTVTVAGDASGLTAVAHGTLAQTDLINWYLNGVLAETTNSMVMRFDALAYGLVADTTYAITAAAVNDLGEGPLSPPASGALNPGIAAETVLGWVAAGFVLAGAIQVGQMTIKPATATDPGGITIPLTSGGVIRFPADGSDAVITAILRARSLVVEDNLRILGTTNAIIGGLQLGNGTTAPTVKPRAGQSWDHASAFLNTGMASAIGSLVGLADGGGTLWYTTLNYTTGKVWGISKTTGALFLVLSDVADYNHPGGLCRVGTDWYVLSYKNSTNEWWVRKYNSSWVFQSQWKRADNIAIYNSSMSIATDGTYLYTAYRETTNKYIRVFRQNLDGTGGTTIFTSTTNPGDILTGFYVGSADFGATRYVVTTTSKVYVFDSSGVRQISQEWSPANAEQVRGLVWDGTRFHSLAPQPSGKLWHYSQIVTDTARSITHTWYDNAGTTHETEASPALAYTQAARQWMRVDTDPPAYAGDPDDPNAIRIYIANKRQADLGTGITTDVYDVPSTGGAAAPTSNGFVSVSAPGNLTSAATDGLGALIKLLGSGSGRTGWNRWSTAGKLQGTAGLQSAATNQTGIATSTWTKVTLTGTARFNEALTISSSEVTIDADGLYDLDADVSWLNDDATGRRIAAIESYTGTDPGVGSGTALDRDERNPSTTSFIHGKPKTKEWLAANTKVRLIVWQNSGTNRTIQNTTTPSKLNVVRCG